MSVRLMVGTAASIALYESSTLPNSTDNSALSASRRSISAFSTAVMSNAASSGITFLSNSGCTASTTSFFGSSARRPVRIASYDWSSAAISPAGRSFATSSDRQRLIECGLHARFHRGRSHCLRACPSPRRRSCRARGPGSRDRWRATVRRGPRTRCVHPPSAVGPSTSASTRCSKAPANAASFSDHRRARRRDLVHGADQRTQRRDDLALECVAHQSARNSAAVMAGCVKPSSAPFAPWKRVSQCCSTSADGAAVARQCLAPAFEAVEGPCERRRDGAEARKHRLQRRLLG